MNKPLVQENYNLSLFFSRHAFCHTQTAPPSGMFRVKESGADPGFLSGGGYAIPRPRPPPKEN